MCEDENPADDARPPAKPTSARYNPDAESNSDDYDAGDYEEMSAEPSRRAPSRVPSGLPDVQPDGSDDAYYADLVSTARLARAQRAILARLQTGPVAYQRLIAEYLHFPEAGPDAAECAKRALADLIDARLVKSDAAGNCHLTPTGDDDPFGVALSVNIERATDFILARLQPGRVDCDRLITEYSAALGAGPHAAGYVRMALDSLRNRGMLTRDAVHYYYPLPRREGDGDDDAPF